MRGGRSVWGLSALLAAAAVACTVTVAEPGEEARVFEGTYDWKQGGSEELRAEFSPDGEDRWQVTFRFRWGGNRHEWKGTAEGSLADGGKLTGTAGHGGRNWIFEASIDEDGVMRGSHREIQRGGKEYDTGTFRIAR